MESAESRVVPVKLTGTLNVLTILTFIGCGLVYISSLIGIVFQQDPKKTAAIIEEQTDKVNDKFPLLAKYLTSSMEAEQLRYENRYLLLASAVVFATFCLIGALMMRRLKKKGFYIYAIGETVPVIIYGMVVGSATLGLIYAMIMALVAVVFIILYANQLKHMR